jgi:SAM-dependent methyltransferase
MNTGSAPSCRLCGHAPLALLIDLGKQPIAHRFLEKPEAEFTHPLKLEFCDRCGLGQICDPISPEILYKDYNYCFSSWKPEPHRERELDLICTHKPAGKVFEIGCNDGLFLEQLKLRGHAVCVGLEPNSFAAQIARETRKLPVYETFVNEHTCQDALRTYGKFDIVMARQVLEHVGDLELFFRCVDLLLADDGMVFIDVPDVGPGLRVGDCTIAWEEHVNYFTEPVLTGALDRFGFTPLAFEKFNYSGGTLAVLARRKGAADQLVLNGDFRELAGTFNQRVGQYAAKLKTTLGRAKKLFDYVVIYGVGCRACALVNGLGLATLMDFAVDDQVERQGKLMPGSKLPIRDPGVLAIAGKKSLVLLAVNQENEVKVEAKTRSRCQNSEVAFLSVFGPSDINTELDTLAKRLSDK